MAVASSPNGGILPITVHRLSASENEQPVTLSEVEGSCRLRYGYVYCQRWNNTQPYRNRKDSTPLRGSE